MYLHLNFDPVFLSLLMESFVFRNARNLLPSCLEMLEIHYQPKKQVC